MASLATWMRPKDEKWFQQFFAKHPEIRVIDARKGDVPTEEMDGLLLTGGSDITPEFLRQENVDPTLLQQDDLDPNRDRWEFEAISKAVARGLPILGICRGIQVLNVALGGTLILDIPGHGLPEQKDQDIQPLRYDGRVQHQYQNVNSSHHQAIDRVADGFEVEAWCTMTTSSSKCACAIIHLRWPSNIIPSVERSTTRSSKISLPGSNR